jgi:hypothetical protein
VNGVRQKPLSEKTIRDWYTNGVPPNVSQRFFENKTLIDLRETPEHIKTEILNEYAKEPLGSVGKVLKYLHHAGLTQLKSALMDDINKI